jgi:hypothetical protein
MNEGQRPPCVYRPAAAFLCGAFGLLMMLFEEVSKTECVQFRYYVMVVGLMSGGLAMIGIGQGLRRRLLILGKA